MASYRRRPVLLTAGERRFFHEGLWPAVADRYLVSFKVRLTDVITVDDLQSQLGRKIAQKHLDFVLVTPKTTRIVAAIELDDASHESPARQRRDEMIAAALASAHVPVATFLIYRRYEPDKIRRKILATIHAARNRKHSSC